MSPTLPTGADLKRSTERDPDHAARSTSVDQWLEMLRKAIVDSGWTLEAVAKHLRIDKAHLFRMLDGEKPFRIEHLVGLPKAVEALFERRRAEHFGLIVVEVVDDETARRHLVSGLVGVLAPRRLPTRASSMAKAEGHPAKKVEDVA